MARREPQCMLVDQVQLYQRYRQIRVSEDVPARQMARPKRRNLRAGYYRRSGLVCSRAGDQLRCKQVGGQGTAEQVTLSLVTAEVTQGVALFRTLDPLSQHG